ncbi:MAG: cellulase family glycosylhydrolase [Anaerolineae bacterium]|jgi:mannan endo-1,4-beta-mannosidase|nr:cellulase family glycosylhydrolase [Anaerolineae bacterium]
MLRIVLLLVCLLALPISAQDEAPPLALPTYQGYISVSPNGRYFVDETGQGFLVIGQNDAISWPGLNTLLDGSSPEQTEDYIRDLRAHGITVSRIMIEYAQQPSSYLENPVGEFSPSVVAFWDALIPMAEAHGLYLLLTPYDTFWQSHHWDTYPYNATVGGPCETRNDWITGEACIEAQKNRWRFMIDRWGDSPNIFAWDVLNEVELWWNATDAEIEAYVTEMTTFVREYQIERWGRSPMISVSSAAAVPEGRLGRVIYQHPALDFANTHLYMGDIRDPADPIMSGVLMSGGVLLSLDQIDDDRPYFDSESGPIDDWIIDPQFDQEYHRHMSWGHLAACGAGSGMRWPYTNPHFILPELRDNLLALARFASTVDWANFASDNISAKMRMSDRSVFRVGCSDGQTAIVWLLADRRRDETVTISGKTLTINEVFTDGDYQVEYWETAQGIMLQRDSLTVSDEMLTLTIPEFEADLPALALIVRSQN